VAEHHRRVVAALIVPGRLASYPMGVFLMAVVTTSLPPPAPTAPPIRGSGIVVSMNDAAAGLRRARAGRRPAAHETV